MKRTLLLIGLLITSLARDVRGCGPGWMAEDYRFWLLQPELGEIRELHPFHFTTDVTAPIDEDAINEWAHRTNLAEWQATVGPSVPIEEIDAVLYGGGQADTELSTERIESSAFLRRLRAMKDRWLAFIPFLRTCELACTQEDPWGFGEGSSRPIAQAWEEGAALLKRARDPRLRARIAYQMVRLAHYDGTGGQGRFDAEPLYRKHLLPMRGKTWLEPSAAFYLASKLPNPECDLAYARIFGAAVDKRFRMVQLFETGRTEEYLELAEDDKQRAMLLVMRNLQNPGRSLEDLERIAQWDPGNEFLPMLLSREVNKLEDWLLTPDLTDFGSAIRQYQHDEGVTREEVLRTDLDHLHAVQAFIDKVTPTLPAQQNTLRVLRAHLSLVEGDLYTCEKDLAQVLSDPTATELERAQAGLDRLVCAVLTGDRLSEAAGARFIELLALVHTSEDFAMHREIILDQLHLYFGKKLIERGELAEGIFLLGRSHRLHGVTMGWWGRSARMVAFEQATPEDYDRMIALLGKPDKTPFELYLVGITPGSDDLEQRNEIIDALALDHGSDLRLENHLNTNTLLDFKAMWFVERERLEEAAAILRQIPDTHWEKSPFTMFSGDDPFIADVEDPHNYEDRDSANYNKRTIIERMVALEKEAARNPGKRALNNFLLGNAYFNFTWHGKYWIMSRLGWSTWGGEYAEERTDPNDDYFGCARAKTHYETALEEARDPVLKALACRMVMECDANWLAYTRRSKPDGWAEGYRDLVDGRSAEIFAEIEECMGYAEYVRRYR